MIIQENNNNNNDDVDDCLTDNMINNNQLNIYDEVPTQTKLEQSNEYHILMIIQAINL